MAGTDVNPTWGLTSGNKREERKSGGTEERNKTQGSVDQRKQKPHTEFQGTEKKPMYSS